MGKHLFRLTDAEQELKAAMDGITGDEGITISLINKVQQTYPFRPRYEVMKIALERLQHQVALLKEKGLRYG